ncbi:MULTISPECIES: hypothetical protein [Sutcliffiella]|uniref:Uncharacterized protein n=1 Tax=Sutcliffiella cohnii TaxID=33932 RepID=A0A223KKS9_9BACI|nr:MULTISPECIES: hypothetical protein [Sutcliffiella]AST90090.1 hypothetical protein BC6307_01725 [Sutcliffiella cohnii]WBL15722.1 hypothetical protein O1A01_03470 [Sutcliffiella sp. NC1]
MKKIISTSNPFESSTLKFFTSSKASSTNSLNNSLTPSTFSSAAAGNDNKSIKLRKTNEQ